MRILKVILVGIGCGLPGALIGLALFILVQRNGEGTAEWVTGIATILLTLVTTGLAVATYGLFSQTADLAKATRDALRETQDEAKRTDRRYQQSLTGILTINNIALKYEPAAGDNSGGQSWSSKDGPWLQRVFVSGNVRNIGFGPALSAKLTVVLPRVPYRSGEASFSWDTGLRNWNAGDSHAVGVEPGNLATGFIVKNLTRPLVSTDLAGATITLEWTTIFSGYGWEVGTVDERGEQIRQDLNTPDYVGA